jgi:hypothetical protein
MANEHENEDDLDLDLKVVPEAGEGDPPEDTDPSTPEEKAYAKRLGWVAESEWDEDRAEKAGIRKPARFKTAREFIADTQDNMPFLRDRLQKQDRQIQDMSSQLKDVHEVVISQKKMTEQAVKRARQQGIEEAEQRMRDAVASGEVDDYDKAKEDRDALLKAPVPEEPKPQLRREEQPAADPDAVRWVAANPWFNEDHVLQNAMMSEEIVTKQKNPGLDLHSVLEKAAAMVKRRYPERFGINPRREAPSTVSPSSGARQGKSAFDAIPESDKREYEKQRLMFAKMTGPDGKPIAYTKEEFMREYALA